MSNMAMSFKPFSVRTQTSITLRRIPKSSKEKMSSISSPRKLRHWSRTCGPQKLRSLAFTLRILSLAFTPSRQNFSSFSVPFGWMVSLKSVGVVAFTSAFAKRRRCLRRCLAFSFAVAGLRPGGFAFAFALTRGLRERAKDENLESLF